MQNVRYLLYISLILLSSGCNQQGSIPLPPTDSDFIESTPDLLTARILSIDFNVHGNIEGVSNSTDMRASFTDPSKSKHNIVLNLGNDRTLNLNAVNETVVEFTFCEKNMGTLRVGDKVVIDENDTVKVNGELRSELRQNEIRE